MADRCRDRVDSRGCADLNAALMRNRMSRVWLAVPMKHFLAAPLDQVFQCWIVVGITEIVRHFDELLEGSAGDLTCQTT
jgi:hypothetical protein